MPLFVCSKCNVIENTALGAYWHRRTEPLCSQCDPQQGAWHGRFEREQFAADRWEPESPGSKFVRRKNAAC